MKPIQGFCELSELLLDIHESPNEQECVFHRDDEHGTRNCIIEISEKKRDAARSSLESILFTRNIYSDGRPNSSKVIEVFDRLAGLLLCREHASYHQLLGSQWAREFKERKSEILSQLEKYYVKPGPPDGAEDDKEEAFTDRAQPFATKELTRLVLNIDEEGVARKVTEVLDKQLRVQNRETGCVYIISSKDFESEGVLKIGYSKEHPWAARLKAHERCFGKVEVIKIRPVTYAKRVEHLVLSEFSRVRYKKYCEKCKKTHIEWLKVDKETLVESLDKWCDFFDKFNTYKKDGQFMALPEEGLKLPSPALAECLKQKRSPRSTPSKGTPGGKSSSKSSASRGGSGRKKTSQDSAKKDTSARGAHTETIAETPTKTFRPRSSTSISPSYSHPKTPTTAVVPIPDTQDSVPEGNDVVQGESEDSWLARTIRRLVF